MKEDNITKFTIIICATFFISSLTQNAYCTNGCKSSLMVLLVGLLGILTEIGAIASLIIDKINGHSSSVSNNIGATFTWLANPILLFSMILLRHSIRTALILSLVSTMLILYFLVFDKVLDNEAGHYIKVSELKLGYWLWLLSSLTILSGSLIITKMRIKNNEKKSL